MSTLPAPPLTLPVSTPLAARAALRALGRLRHGSLLLQLPDGTQVRAGTGDGPAAAISVHRWSVFGAVLRRGDIGFAEGFIDGHWSTPDLRALLSLLLANRDALESMFHGSGWGSLLARIRHLLNRNSRAGSRRNIHAHYDLGNAFYALWLDETMNYSSAWFEGDAQRPLPDAQRAKVRRALGECRLQPGQRLLEIGCGWGALAECAAGEFGAQVTGVTLSSEQLAYAQQRLQKAGLAERARLRLQDYRDIADGPFDAIASIEMLEAVGREYWPVYFGALNRLLKPGGRACVQSIVIRDNLFERYASSTDFIQQYVFPGGMLPSPTAVREQAARAGLRVVREMAFGADYARTLRAWRERFAARDRAVRDLGFDARFLRLWDFYLAYCEAAFEAGDTDVVQFTFEKDGAPA